MKNYALDAIGHFGISLLVLAICFYVTGYLVCLLLVGYYCFQLDGFFPGLIPKFVPFMLIIHAVVYLAWPVEVFFGERLLSLIDEMPHLQAHFWMITGIAAGLTYFLHLGLSRFWITDRQDFRDMGYGIVRGIKSLILGVLAIASVVGALYLYNQHN